MTHTTTTPAPTVGHPYPNLDHLARSAGDLAARAELATRLGPRRRRFTVRDAHKAIAVRRDFTASELWGHPVSDGAYVGQGWQDAATYRRMLADRPSYVVGSFGTVIGWITADGRAVVPAVTYSSRTSRHQGRARTGLELATVPGSLDLLAGGELAVRHPMLRGFAWVGGELVAPDTVVRVTGRPFRSRLLAEHVTVADVPARMLQRALETARTGADVGAMAATWHATPGARFSDVRAELIPA